MGAKRKKIGAAGKYGAGIGRSIRNVYNDIERVQRKKQICPYCSKPGVKRKSAGIWNCKKCDKTFTGQAYFLERQI